MGQGIGLSKSGGGSGPSGDDTLVPLTGTKTATGNIISNQANFTLSFTNTNDFSIQDGSGNRFFDVFFDGLDSESYLKGGDASQTQNFSKILSGNNYFDLYAQDTNSSNFVEIISDAPTKTINHYQDILIFDEADTSLTTQFLNTNTFSVEDGSGNPFIHVSNGSLLFTDASTNYGINITGFTLDMGDWANNANFTHLSIDDTAQTITLTATHFNYVTLQDFASNAAALLGGLNVGDLYKTVAAGQAVVKVVV